MTKELDARARAFAKKQCDKYGDEEEIFSYHYNEYIDIANEQKAIDIEKACEWMEKQEGALVLLKKETIEEFRKALEG